MSWINRRAIRRTVVALILLMTTTVGSATAQGCAATCLLFYGRFTVSTGEIFWYSSCTSTVMGSNTYIHCYYESGRWILPT